MVHKSSDMGFFVIDGGGYLAHLDSTAATRAEESTIERVGNATLDELCCGKDGEVVRVCGLIGTPEDANGRYEF